MSPLIYRIRLVSNSTTSDSLKRIFLDLFMGKQIYRH